MNSVTSTFEQEKMRINRAELIERMQRHAQKDSFIEVYPGVFIAHASKPTESQMSVCKPVVCVIAQGSKDVFVNNQLFHYDAGHYLISTLDLPIKSNVVEASEDKPYLNFLIGLDLSLVAEVMIDLPTISEPHDAVVPAIEVSPLNADLLETVVKFIKLLDAPDEIHFLAPLILREMIYRLLKGQQGARLSQFIHTDGNAHRINKAVQHIRDHLDQPFKIDEIARELGMSVSGFHQHFKAVTMLSPLQFQKNIRLQEARRLMLSENLDVASAGARVGYDDSAYFNREYKKTFGLPPLRDISNLRQNLPKS